MGQHVDESSAEPREEDGMTVQPTDATSVAQITADERSQKREEMFEKTFCWLCAALGRVPPRHWHVLERALSTSIFAQERPDPYAPAIEQAREFIEGLRHRQGITGLSAAVGRSC